MILLTREEKYKKLKEVTDWDEEKIKRFLDDDEERRRKKDEEDEQKRILKIETFERIMKIIIPKEELEDGVWYENVGLDDKDFHYFFTRGGKNIGQWDAEAQQFNVPEQQQLGADGHLHHLVDAMEKGYAGFGPVKKIE